MGFDVTSRTFIDGHVHIYDCADPARFLSAVARNLDAVDRDPDAEGCLILTESGDYRRFDDLADAAPGTLDGWQVEPVPEDPAALKLVLGTGRTVWLIAGRQIVTSERIEVLTIGTTARFPDDRPIRETLTALREAGVPAVLPWGVGKWTGGRGRLVVEIFAEQGGRGVMLGDNGGRPRGWPKPSLFSEAEARHIPIIPGTDPLPLPGAEDTVASFGFVLPGHLDPEAPARDLVRRIAALTDQPETFGRRRGLGTVVGEQIALRRRKAG